MMSPSPGFERPAGPLRVQRTTDANAYYVKILLSDEDDPASIHVETKRNMITIKRREDDARQEETTYGPEGGDTPGGYSRGYHRSFSHSYSSYQRRMKVPPDADLSKMTRHDTDDAIEITIPRLQQY
jgi:hypothetical protein